MSSRYDQNVAVRELDNRRYVTPIEAFGRPQPPTWPIYFVLAIIVSALLYAGVIR